jgi:hypothetical protein
MTGTIIAGFSACAFASNVVTQRPSAWLRSKAPQAKTARLLSLFPKSTLQQSGANHSTASCHAMRHLHRHITTCKLASHFVMALLIFFLLLGFNFPVVRFRGFSLLFHSKQCKKPVMKHRHMSNHILDCSIRTCINACTKQDFIIKRHLPVTGTSSSSDSSSCRFSLSSALSSSDFSLPSSACPFPSCRSLSSGSSRLLMPFRCCIGGESGGGESTCVCVCAYSRDRGDREWT